MRVPWFFFQTKRTRDPDLDGDGDGATDRDGASDLDGASDRDLDLDRDGASDRDRDGASDGVPRLGDMKYKSSALSSELSTAFSGPDGLGIRVGFPGFLFRKK
jgi:hypothetical protein